MSEKTGFSYNIIKKLDTEIQGSLGRVGVIHTPHGDIQTPAFVTVGTKGTVKALTPEAVQNLGADVVLANTYHLYLQPGDELVKNVGGLAQFMNWKNSDGSLRPTMTDSGGFQVFSLGAAYGKNLSKLIKKTGKEELILNEGKIHANDVNEQESVRGNRGGENDYSKGVLAKIDEDGVMFRSHIDGSAHYFTPEKSIDIQHNIGADIIFAFDECTSPTETFTYQREALDRTHRWAKRCLKHHHEKQDELVESGKNYQALFGVIQGGREEVLRKESAKYFKDLKTEVNSKEREFDGYGIGGSFAKDDMETAVKWVNEILPEEKPRHLLGIGEPEDLFMAVENGCDLFDCVAPTRIGRNGQMYTINGKINILNAKFSKDVSKVDDSCACYTCTNYTKAYIQHLFKADEMLAATLASTHNLFFIINLVKTMRAKILEGKFEEFKKEFLVEYLR